MKQALASILSGASFGFAFGIVVSLYLFFAYGFDDYAFPKEELIPSEYFDVTVGRLVTSGENLVVVGSVTNNSKSTANPVRVSAKLYDEQGLFGDCFWDPIRIGAGETKPFVVRCPNFRPTVADVVVAVEPYVLEAEIRDDS